MILRIMLQCMSVKSVRFFPFTAAARWWWWWWWWWWPGANKAATWRRLSRFSLLFSFDLAERQTRWEHCSPNAPSTALHPEERASEQSNVWFADALDWVGSVAAAAAAAAGLLLLVPAGAGRRQALRLRGPLDVCRWWSSSFSRVTDSQAGWEENLLQGLVFTDSDSDM